MSNKMVVAIHQPNFYPWLGYFNKIARCDTFVFMDNVAYPKSGNSMGSWTNRVKILVQGKPAWVGCRVLRKHGAQLIKDVIINDSYPWREKLLKTLEFNYKRTPYYREVIQWLEPSINKNITNLAEYNILSIKEVCNILKINREFITQSQLNVENNSTELLIEITKKVRGTAYLCGGGASGYQEDDKFMAANIELVYQDFQHPVYKQNSNKEFVLGLSIVDVLMNCGFEETRYLLIGDSE